MSQGAAQLLESRNSDASMASIHHQQRNNNLFSYMTDIYESADKRVTGTEQGRMT